MLETYGWLIGLAVIGGVLVLLLNLFNRKGRVYEQREHLFSRSELRFLRVLDQAVGARFRIMGKVRVADLVQPRKGMSRSQWQRAFNPLCGKHVDYVLCDRATLRPVCVVELDDASHNRSDRRDRDGFINRVFEEAALPLIRFHVRRQYDVNVVSETLNRACMADHPQ